MRVLLVLAHGSRIAKSNEEVEAFASRLAELTQGYDAVVPCFLELTDPSFEHTLLNVAKDSPSDIVIYPHFLAEGRHVRDDVPRILEEFRTTHPAINTELMPYLGNWSGLAEFVAKGL